ncbi:MAG: Tetratricopeptide repeat-like domain [Deltaproteobacteria bacterium]|nr:Tetratricopeptide repeat-like domain [Deltaproteobacteria bacterium]
MTDACQELRAALARGPNDPLPPVAEQHLATCTTCQAHAEAHDQLIAALRVEPAPVDDVTRARWLAQMAPVLDGIALGHAPHRAPRRAAWFAMIAGATAIACLGWWLGHRAPEGRPVAAPAIANLDRELLRPYIVSGGSSDPIATTLLAGRFSALELVDGQLVRASFEHDRDQRIAVVGPARIVVTAANPHAVELELAGTLLVDARAPTSVIDIHTHGVTIHGQQATFAVQAGGDAPVVFVDRGEVLVGTTRVGPGEWSGPEAARSAAVVALLRDHANAIAPPAGRGGIVAVDGNDPVVTQGGAILGTAPLWARLERGPLALVTTGSVERRAQLEVRDGAIVRLPKLAATAPVTAATVPVPPADRVSARTPSTPRNARTEPTPPGAAPDLSSSIAPDASSPETAAQLYARAEDALRTGARADAEAIWIQLLAAYPTSPHAASALYDLANLARARGDRRAAQAYLARLLAGSPPAVLRETAVYASCRLHVEAGELASATTCLTGFRTSFADSSHDAEVLAWLAGRAQETGGCAVARALTTEYLRRYPRGPFAARAATCEAVE